MVVFPNAKINIGLNIVAKRSDGYHNIETIFFPVKGLCDILEIVPFNEQTNEVEFNQTGLILNEPNENNLCVKAYHLLKTFTELPHVKIHLHKQIPFGAGLGGGSSDGAHTLSVLNKLSSSPLSNEQLSEVALKLGSDCPFFILNSPCYATGRGENLNPIKFDLNKYHILLVNPGIHINTSKAYSLTTPKPSVFKLQNSILEKPENWKGKISNDFERVVFDLYPEIGVIKDGLYEMGAVYSAMSGSGSTVFGLFEKKPDYDHLTSEYYTFYQKL
ncbi:MAG: 4-(cytidine 5'-diphospho)-2-C-methyl-D-erythritol kinase [Tenuifilaceae bacterium]